MGVGEIWAVRAVARNAAVIWARSRMDRGPVQIHPGHRMARAAAVVRGVVVARIQTGGRKETEAPKAAIVEATERAGGRVDPEVGDLEVIKFRNYTSV